LFIRTGARTLLTAAAFFGLFIALTLPNRLEWIDWRALGYFPLEFLVIAGLLLLPGRSASVSRVVLGLLVGLAMLLRVADLAAYQIFARPFSLIFDLHLLADGNQLLTGVFGDLAAVGVALLLALVLALMFWLAFAMLGRIQRVLQRDRRLTLVALALLAVGWGVLRGSGWTRASNFAWDQLVFHSRDTLESLRDIREFAAIVNEDQLLARAEPPRFERLSGKDVYVVFAESYGRVALEKEPFAESVTATLRQAQEQLAADGVLVRSAYLASPTVGGLSWLAHASVLSGAWINSETRYESLILSERVTLNKLFQQAGWRTVAAMPAISMAWPEGQYYGYDHIYDAHNFGYEGLPYNWVTMPDQYVWSALHERERNGSRRGPVMAEIALISSHAPWTPIARLVPWDQVGDGQVFNEQGKCGGKWTQSVPTTTSPSSTCCRPWPPMCWSTVMKTWSFC